MCDGRTSVNVQTDQIQREAEGGRRFTMGNHARRGRWRPLRAVVPMVVMILVVAACSSSDDDASPATTAPPPTPTTTRATTTSPTITSDEAMAVSG